MQVLDDEIWLCQDCALYAANGDTSGIDDERREKQVIAGVDALGPNLVCNSAEDGSGDLEFSWSPCEGCGTSLGGSRMRFALLQFEMAIRKDES